MSMPHQLYKERDPFKQTAPTPQGLVAFWVERPTHVRIGKKAARIFMENLFGEKEGRTILRNGFFYVDTQEDAIHCVKVLKKLQDIEVAQFVFGARAFKAVD